MLCNTRLQLWDSLQLFDWKLQDMPMGEDTYTMVDVGGGTGGGIMKNPVPDAPSQWLSYISVDDVAASLEKAKSLGGKVLHERHEISNFGWFGVVQDPTGAVFGIWQEMTK